jgi:hypothetical protein
MDALRVVAIAALLAAMVAVYLVARDGVGPWFAIPVAATVGMASALAEPTAFGGYPQQIAFAALLIATWGVARYLAGGRGRDLVPWAGGLAVAALAHHVYFPLALLVGGAVWLVSAVGDRAIMPRRSLAIAVTALPAVACFLPILIAFRDAGYRPPLDAGGLGLVEAVRYGIREAPRLWGALLVGGTAALVLTTRSPRPPAWRVAVALIAVAAPLFAVTREVRLLPPLLAGAVLGCALGTRRLAGAWPGWRGTALALTAAAALPVVLWPRADAAASDYFRYYRVVSPALLAAAEAIDPDVDGLVVVRHDRRGWPLGWWFEGLTEAPIVVGSDERWLGFPEERERARLASRFFDERHDGPETARLAAAAGVELLVFRKWEWIGWERWLGTAGDDVTVVYDDDEYMVLDVAAGPVVAGRAALPAKGVAGVVDGE